MMHTVRTRFWRKVTLGHRHRQWVQCNACPRLAAQGAAERCHHIRSNARRTNKPTNKQDTACALHKCSFVVLHSNLTISNVHKKYTNIFLEHPLTVVPMCGLQIRRNEQSTLGNQYRISSSNSKSFCVLFLCDQRKMLLLLSAFKQSVLYIGCVVDRLASR